MTATSALHYSDQLPMDDSRLELCPMALVERLGPLEIVYGRWDKVFGCWIYENGKPTRRASPASPLLDKRGKLSLSEIQLSVELEERNASIEAEEAVSEAFKHHLEEGIPGYSSKVSPMISRPNDVLYTDDTVWDVYDFEVLEKFHTFIELIPISVRQLAAQFGNNQWLVLEAIWTQPHFEFFVEQSVVDGSMGYVSACLMLAGWYSLNSIERQGLILEICSKKRRNVLSGLLKREVSHPTLKAVSKLRFDESDEPFWDDFFRVLANPRKAKALAHAKSLTPETIRNVAALPGKLCLPGMVSVLGEVDLREIIEARCNLDLNELDDRPVSRVRQILKHVRTEEDLEDRLDRIEAIIFEYQEFPSPPILGNGHLQPLSSFEALQLEAKEMRNCVDQFAEAVLRGRSYYYSWHGTERATVETTSQKNGAWILAEHLGPRNASLRKDTSLEIMKSVLEGQIECSCPGLEGKVSDA